MISLIKKKKYEKQLWKACQSGDLERVKGLVHIQEINWNAHDSKGSRTGYTALHYACRYGHLDVVKFLLTTDKVNIKEKSDRGWTPIHFACISGHLNVVKFLLTMKGMNAMEKDHGGDTPLHNACINGHLDVIKFLSTLRDVDVMEKNNDGSTPLHYACCWGRLNVVRFLIEEEGCDYSLQNNYSKIPRDMAIEYDQTSIINYIDNISENPNFTLSRQNERRLKRSMKEKDRNHHLSPQEKINRIVLDSPQGNRSNQLTKHILDSPQENPFNQLTNTMLENGQLTNENIHMLVQSITNAQDICILYTMAKTFMKIGTLSSEQWSNALQLVFTKVIDKKLCYENQDYVSIKRILDEVKDQNLISDDDYNYWEQEVRKINGENVSWVHDIKSAIVANAVDIHLLQIRYDQLRDDFEVFYTAYREKIEREKKLGLVRTGVSLLRLIPFVPDFSGLVIDYAVDISNPLEFCRLVCEESSIQEFLQNEKNVLVLKPVVTHILKKSNIEQRLFLSVTAGLLSEVISSIDVEDTSVDDIVRSLKDFQTDINDKLINGSKDDKKKHITNYTSERLKSETASNQEDSSKTDYQTSNTMKLKNLCNALQGQIIGDDFVDDIDDCEYIAALCHSEGNLSEFMKAIRHIRPHLANINERAKLLIKRDSCEDIETEITALQYAAICGYTDIIEHFFLSEDQTSQLNFGLDKPVTYFTFTSRRHTLLVEPNTQNIK